MSIQQVAAVLDRSKSRGGARLVMISIANHDGDGGSWPTIDTICREAGLSERSVHEALRRLQDDGELKVHPNAGGTMDWRNDRRPNRYEILLPHGVEESATPSESRGGSSPRNGVEESSTQTVQEPSTISTRSQIDDGFNRFWADYPLKKGKVAALKAYERAVRRADKDPGQAIWKINTAAAVYASQRFGHDPQYTAHPTTWLNQGRWDDEDLQQAFTPRANDYDNVKYV